MKTILVIEDEPQTRENLATILTMEGYRALTARHGREGLEVARRELPDVIVCDVSMPELDGHEVLQALRADPATADIAFIFLTARGERGDQRLGMTLGADDYLAKPATASELLGAIAARLARQSARLATAREDKARTEGFAPNFNNAAPLEQLGLTPREAEVALWVAQGKANADVARILGATESTVKKHIQSIFLKFGLESRSALTLRVVEALHGR